MNEPQCVAAAGAILGEGPVWHDGMLGVSNLGTQRQEVIPDESHHHQI